MSDHGTMGRYRDGCRCDDCRARNRDDKRRWRAGLRHEPRGRTCGTISKYNHEGCRCVDCTAAATRKKAAYRKRKRKERLAAAREAARRK